MANCDEGYLCEVCEQPVDEIVDSDLYLRYILGELDYSQLAVRPERHIRCNPSQAQFIVDDAFELVIMEGVFAKCELDAASVGEQEDRVTRAWQRLQEVAGSGIPIDEYPLANVPPS